MGFNPNDASDNVLDHDGDGYTNIEEYLNGSASATPNSFVDDLANGEIAVSGTATGSYVNTQANDSSYESIQERESSGKPANRYSFLEHKWTIDVNGGYAVTFYVDAHQTASSDGDNFVFAYSTDDANYMDMLTVTKTSDDSTYQTFNLPGTLSGTVYIRVKDTDQTRGNRSLDIVFIDHMFIRSDFGTSPPPAPTGLTATPGDFQVSLTWNTSAGAESYNVHRSTTSGALYTTIATSVTANSYTDTGLNNGTTYYYVVSAVNSFGESAASNEAGAKPQAPTDMHVQSITVTTVKVSKAKKKGHAQVVIVDNNGEPVPGADVTGTFSGDINEGPLPQMTDDDGQAVIETTGTAKGGVSIMFCVDNVTHATLTYDPDANVESCDTNK